MKNNRIRPLAFLQKLRGKNKKHKKKVAPDDVIYSPAEDLTPLSRIVGIGMRALILLLGIFGFTAFICNPFEFTVAYNSRFFAISTGYIFLVSLIVSVFCGFWYYSEITKLIAIPAGVGVYLGICAIINDFLSIHNGVSPSYMMVVLEI